MLSKRFVRCLRVFRLAESPTNGKTTIKELAQEFQVSRRTILRDRRALREAGFLNGTARADNGYKTLPAGQPGRYQLADEELVSLALAVHLASRLCSARYSPSVVRAMKAVNRLLESAPAAVREDAVSAVRRVAIRDLPRPAK
jgi:predicted DNA-binding transcriptional regulator YafY